MHYELATFEPDDAAAVNRVASAAFQQYRDDFGDWDGFARKIANMAALAETADLLVARGGGEIGAAVAYVGPGREKACHFEAEWAVMRMLVVEPRLRGMGIGHALARECIRRAQGDEAPVIALHTSSIMNVALAIYERLGFRFARNAAVICGVPYSVYGLQLAKANVDRWHGAAVHGKSAAGH